MLLFDFLMCQLKITFLDFSLYLAQLVLSSLWVRYFLHVDPGDRARKRPRTRERALSRLKLKMAYEDLNSTTKPETSSQPIKWILAVSRDV